MADALPKQESIDADCRAVRVHDSACEPGQPARGETGDDDPSGNHCPAGDECAYYQEVVGLRTEVVTDPLTGLYNLRYFREALEQELERTQRTLISTAVMMIDLDHFKQINDTYGHEAGNQVLKQTARMIRDTTRRLDIQCRYGGEEFVVILPTTELMLAAHVAERLRENIESTPVFIDDDTVISVTASIGLALHSAERPTTSGGLIEAADEQLYRAKEEGRNRVRYAIFEVPDTQVSGDEKQALGAMFGSDDAADDVPDSNSGDAEHPDFGFGQDVDDEDDFIADDDGEQWIL